MTRHDVMALRCAICGKVLVGRQHRYSDETGEVDAYYGLECHGDDGHFYGVHAASEVEARALLALTPPASGGRDGDLNSLSLDALARKGKDAGLEDAALVVEQCNREGPYTAIGAASRIRALKQDAGVAAEEQDKPSAVCTSPSPSDAAGAGEVAITEAIKRMDEIGRDWKADGQMQKFYATNYLVEAIRPLMHLTPSKGER